MADYENDDESNENIQKILTQSGLFTQHPYNTTIKKHEKKQNVNTVQTSNFTKNTLKPIRVPPQSFFYSSDDEDDDSTTDDEDTLEKLDEDDIFALDNYTLKRKEDWQYPSYHAYDDDDDDDDGKNVCNDNHFAKDELDGRYEF
eukprot:342640_1